MIELIPSVMQAVTTIFTTEPFNYIMALAILSGVVGILLKFRR